MCQPPRDLGDFDAISEENDMIVLKDEDMHGITFRNLRAFIQLPHDSPHAREVSIFTTNFRGTGPTVQFLCIPPSEIDWKEEALRRMKMDGTASIRLRGQITFVDDSLSSSSSGVRPHTYGNFNYVFRDHALEWEQRGSFGDGVFHGALGAAILFFVLCVCTWAISRI